MKLPKHPTLLRRMRDARVKDLAPRCPPLAASLGTQRGGGCQVTLKRRGKTRTVYVPKELKDEVEAWVQEHRRLAHLILQLIERGSLLPRHAKELFGSLANLAKRLAESIRNVLIPADGTDPVLAAKIQIRIDTS